MRVVAVLLAVLAAASAASAMHPGFLGGAITAQTLADFLRPLDPNRATPADLMRQFGASTHKLLATMVRHHSMPMIPKELKPVMATAFAQVPVAERHDDAVVVAALRAAIRARVGASEYPYFAFLPQDAGTVLPEAVAPLSLSTACWSNIVFAAQIVNSTLQITVNVANQKELFCSDAFLLFAEGSAHLFLADEQKQYNINLDLSAYTPADLYLLQHQGLRVLKFPKPVLSLVNDLIETVTLLLGFAEDPISNATMAANAHFMKKYVEASPRLQPISTARAAGFSVFNGLNLSDIQSGDFIALVRYDGLDPMIGWGEGVTAGHTTIAMRSETTGDLHVCESTAKDAYWPVNGIQCTPIALWIQRVESAQMNLVWVPLAPKYRKMFDAKKAWAFFKAHEGFNYGYLNFLFGWLDTPVDNFPCLPPDYSSICLNSVTAQALATVIDKLMPTSTENIFRQALNFRVNTTNLPVTDVIAHALRRNMTFADIFTIPERDDWMYNTTRYGQPAVGRAMVCCVFVCSMWKAAGVFSDIGSDIQCGEQTVWDIASMHIFDSAMMGAGRPAICQTADPNNELCQLGGPYTFHLKPDLNARHLYPKMGEKCSSKAPDYVRRQGC